jgi:hypothetical protein
MNRVQALLSIFQLAPLHPGQTVRLYCGNSRCMRAGLLADGVAVERLLVQHLSHGGAVQVASIKTRVESACGINA